MKQSLLSQHFAPCSEERLRHRLAEAEEYDRTMSGRIHLWDCKDPEEYKALEAQGKGEFETPVYHPDAETINIQSRPWDGDEVHEVSIRILRPKGQPKGIFMFIHGGGFATGSATYHDNLLMDMAERMSLIMASVEYRLAPRHKLPAASRDCTDAAMYLMSDECEQKLGTTLRFICGESSGAYLTVQSAIMLRDLGVNVRDKLAGLMSVYGISDLSLLPSVRIGTITGGSPALPLDQEDMNFIALCLPSDVWNSRDKLKDPEFSPVYADLSNLPSAFFTVGSIDSLIDDSILLAARWELAGNESELTIYPGSPHGYMVDNLDVTEEAVNDIVDYVKRRLES